MSGEDDIRDPSVPLGADRIEVEDPGETLEAALEEEERSAIAAMEGKLRSVERDLTELKDRHVRKLAEFDNMRKRTEREKTEYFRLALLDLARGFLPIVDDLERAMSHASAEERSSDFGQGIGLIRRQIVDLWRRHGLEEVDTSGGFDPNVHEAVATEETDELPPNTIVEVLRRGYLLNDKLVQPALVKVAVRRNEAGQARTSGGGT
ncbi:MAG TPA: nucleotide exchange factor GrpE [Thermoanaerobaculia bacterium]|nr:nucleotide exchange factor GrpE [Thermoanaerobaculia bacterium]